MVTCGISDSFESLSPTSGQVTYVLLSRSPLAFPLAGIGPFDLHVLCTPPAFVLSQNQTLRQKNQTHLSVGLFKASSSITKSTKTALCVPTTLQLLKIVPRPPKGNGQRADSRMLMIPRGRCQSQRARSLGMPRPAHFGD